MGRMTYLQAKFHWSKTVIITTVLTVIVLLATVVGVALYVPLYEGILIYVTVALALLITLIYCPLYVAVIGNTFIIRRVVGAKQIPLVAITNVEALERRDLVASTRLWGSGGLFGYIGLFYNKKIGRYHVYATEMSHLYLIATEKRRYVISCRNPELIAALRAGR